MEHQTWRAFAPPHYTILAITAVILTVLNGMFLFQHRKIAEVNDNGNLNHRRQMRSMFTKTYKNDTNDEQISSFHGSRLTEVTPFRSQHHHHSSQLLCVPFSPTDIRPRILVTGLFVFF
jgi:hypothetical protein